MSPLITEKHPSDLDFPEYQYNLLALLNSFRNGVSLPDEALVHTSVIRHAIHLTPRSKPSYSPSYRMPHSRRVLLKTAVKGMLN